MPEVSLLTWTVGVAALVLGILAGHFGWGKRWPGMRARLHPDYLTGLDFLVTEQPDRALDMFLRLMDANADTIETHFSLGSLYRRRGEVERAIRIHQNLLARESLAPEHREQALLALAQDYLRAGLLDRAEGLFLKVSQVERLRPSALDALRGVYERQHDWQQALDTYRLLARIGSAPPPQVAAHYLCELAAAAIERGATDVARGLLRDARQTAAPFPRAAVLRAHVAEQAGDAALAIRLLRGALREAPKLLQDELSHLLELVAPESREDMLRDLVEQAESGAPEELKRLVFAAIVGGLTESPALSAALDRVFAQDATLRAMCQSVRQPTQPQPWIGDGGQRADARLAAREIGSLLVHAERHRCGECGFAARSFYWHCPACQTWDSFEPCAIVKLD